VPALRDAERQNERSFRSRDNYAAVPMFGDAASPESAASDTLSVPYLIQSVSQPHK
jgi:hypothetical protein